jgi:hypothetical protein
LSCRCHFTRCVSNIGRTPGDGLAASCAAPIRPRWTSFAATALSLEGWGIGASILNIDAPVADDPCHYAAALQDAYIGHAAEVDQLLCRTQQTGFEDHVRVGEGRSINGASMSIGMGEFYFTSEPQYACQRRSGVV